MKHCHVMKNVMELQMMNISSQIINKNYRTPELLHEFLKKVAILEYPIVDFL